MTGISFSLITASCQLLSILGVGGVIWDQWWTYDGISGTSYWGVLNPEWSMCHRGRRQSPITIQPELLLFDPHLRFVHIDDTPVSGLLKNTGHGVVFSLNGAHRGQVNITGASLGYRYQLEDIHIHFGLINRQGSEHQISGKAFPAEVQLVAFNSDLYEDLTAAASSGSGIVVVSVLVQHGPDPNHELLRLTNSSAAVPYRDDAVELVNVTVSALLPRTEFFLTYEGSLTWPSCDETVTWILMNKPVYVTQPQLEGLRSLSQSLRSDITKSPLGDNFRIPQPLHHRPVRTNIDFSDTEETLCPTMRKNKRYEANVWFGV